MHTGLSSAAGRGDARYGARVVPERGAGPNQPVESSVTLEKIGDFLQLDLRRILVWLRSGLLIIALMAVAGAVAGGAFALLSKPRFTVSTDVLVDPAGLNVVNEDLYANPGQPDMQLLTAGSKVRVMTSGNVLSRVITDLGLTGDPEFAAPDSRLDPAIVALDSLRRRVQVVSDEKSFVATLSVTTENAGKSIDISNAIIENFREELMRGETEGANRTADRLEERLQELRSAVSVAEGRVETYKRENGLQSSSGELTSSLSLNQLNTQVIEAQARLIAAESAYQELVSGGGVGGGEGTQNVTLDALRAQYALVRQQLGSQQMTYGARHPAIVRLTAEAAALDNQIDAEIRRIRQAAKARVDEASAALAALSERSASQRQAVFNDNEALVRLRELERDAQSKAAIYEAFLARSRQLSERGQIDATNIRVISTALPPTGRSWPPRTVLMAAAGGMAGLMLGVVLALGLGMRRDLRGTATA